MVALKVTSSSKSGSLRESSRGSVTSRGTSRLSAGNLVAHNVHHTRPSAAQSHSGFITAMEGSLQPTPQPPPGARVRPDGRWELQVIPDDDDESTPVGRGPVVMHQGPVRPVPMGSPIHGPPVQYNAAFSVHIYSPCAPKPRGPRSRKVQASTVPG